PRLNANPLVDEAHHRVPPAGFKYLVTEMVCWATGGPQKYTGRSMKESHQHLKITATEWEAFLDDLQQTLDKFAVPQPEQAEIKAIVASTQADIFVYHCRCQLLTQNGHCPRAKSVPAFAVKRPSCGDTRLSLVNWHVILAGIAGGNRIHLMNATSTC